MKTKMPKVKTAHVESYVIKESLVNLKNQERKLSEIQKYSK